MNRGFRSFEFFLDWQRAWIWFSENFCVSPILPDSLDSLSIHDNGEMGERKAFDVRPTWRRVIWRKLRGANRAHLRSRHSEDSLHCCTASVFLRCTTKMLLQTSNINTSTSPCPISKWPVTSVLRHWWPAECFSRVDIPLWFSSFHARLWLQRSGRPNV